METRNLTQRLLLPSLVCVFGLLLLFNPVLRSGFDTIPGDAADSRLVNWILEHGFQWVRGNPLHSKFWSPPIFYPAQNTAAYTDILLGSGPIYWLFRFLGAPSETAFQLWEIAVSALNFLSMAWLLRRFKFQAAPASIGAFLFAFANARAAQLIHPQLLPQFFTPIALGALIESQRLGRDARLWLITGMSAAVAQLYAGFYLGWFLVFLGAVTFTTLLFQKEPRARLKLWFQTLRLEIAISALLSAALLWPMASHYLAASREIGPRPFYDVALMLPRLKSWFFLGENNLIYGGLASWAKYQPEKLPYRSEHAIGLGFATLLLCLTGFVQSRKLPQHRTLIRSAAIVTLASFLLSLWVGGFSLWRGVFEVFPAGKAIRSVTRLQLGLLLPWAISLAGLLAYRPKWAIPVLALVAAEQVSIYPGYSKTQAQARALHLVRRIPPVCPAFLLAPVSNQRSGPEQQLDAMWASEIIGKPTLNGHSGSAPPGWGFEAVETAHLDAKLADWKKATGFALPPDCVIMQVNPEY